MNLPPPNTLPRQTAIGLPTSPRHELYVRSNLQESFSVDHDMRRRLEAYKTFLDHELDFFQNEIHALQSRNPSVDPIEERALSSLCEGLKVRWNTLQARLAKVKSLLDSM